MPFTSRRSRALTTRRPTNGYKRRRVYPKRQRMMNLYYFARWDNAVQKQWYIRRPNFAAWQVEGNPTAGGNVYSLKTMRPEIALDRVVSTGEFQQLFRWYKIIKTTTVIDFAWMGNETVLSQKESGQSAGGTTVQEAIAENATFAPPDSGGTNNFYYPAKYFKIYTWIDKTAAGYSETQTGYMDACKQIPSMKMLTARKRVIIITRPSGLIVTQILDNQQSRPVMQSSKRAWMTTDYSNMRHYGPVFGIEPCVPLGQSLPPNWGVEFSITTKYVLAFKGTR